MQTTVRKKFPIKTNQRNRKLKEGKQEGNERDRGRKSAGKLCSSPQKLNPPDRILKKRIIL